jgi:hypothetical protein
MPSTPTLDKVAEEQQLPPGMAGQMPRGLIQRALEAHTAEMQEGRFPTFAQPGPHAGAARGLVTANQGLMEALMSFLGPMGAAAGMLGMPYIQQIANKYGIDMNQPFQYGYGGNPQAFAEQQAVSRMLMQYQMQGSGQAASRIMEATSDVLRTYLGDKATGVTDWIASLDPGQLGMFMQQLSIFFPQIQSIMSRVDPSFISDFSPLVKSMYRETGGKFDPAVLKRNVDEFNAAYKSGAFGAVPAQIAVHSMDFAKENLGPRAATVNAANYARAADAFVKHGLANSFGEAMAMVEASAPGEAAFNPERAIAYASYLDGLARQGMVDRKMIQGAAQYAQQNNTSMGAAVNAVLMASRVRSRVGGREGQRYADMAAQAISGAAKSTSMKLLAAAYEGDKKARTYIDRAIEQGDTAALNKLSRKLRNNPRAISRAQFADSDAFVNRLSMGAPGILDSFVRGEVQRAASGNKQLQSLLANKAELARRMKTRDFSGLSDKTVEALSRGGGRLGAVALSTGGLPEYYKPTTAKDLASTRLGMQFPKPVEPKAPEIKKP